MFDPATWRAVLATAASLLPRALSAVLGLFRRKPEGQAARRLVVVYVVVVPRCPCRG
jgi:hypothetical protein